MRAIAEKIRKRAGHILAALVLAICVMCMKENTIVSLADMQIKLNTNAIVRSETSTESGVVGNVSSGTTLTSVGTVTDASGMDWYQVSVNGATGYIRSDLAEVTGESDSSGGESESTESPAEGGGSLPTSGTIISEDNANVRSGPSSSDTPVTTVTSGTVVAITGQETDSEGTPWYAVEVDGTTGYIRADLIDPIKDSGETAGEGEQAEGEMPEGDYASGDGSAEVKQVLSSKIIPEGTDLEDMEGDESALSEWALGNYFLLRTEDSTDGNETWYLYSTENHKFEKVDLIRNGEGGSGVSLSSLMEGKGKFVILGVAALFLILIVVCIVLAVKLGQYREEGVVSSRPVSSRSGRNRYDDDDDDDDEEDDDEYEDDDDEDEEEYEDDDEYEEEDEEEYEDEDDEEYDEDDEEYDEDEEEYDDEEDDDEYDDDDEYEDEEEERSVKKRRWSPKNFLSRREEEDDDEYDDEYDDDEYEDDDEDYDDEEYDDDEYMDDDDFEFEFLNMDDDDKY